MLTEVDHVTNYLKKKSIDRLIDNRNNSPFESEARDFIIICKIRLTKPKASKTEMFLYNIARVLALYKSYSAAMNKIFIYARRA